MLAAVIRSASPSSRDKGDPYYCFRSLDSMKLRSGAVVWALFVCGLVLGVFLTSSVLWIALEISSCLCKGISHKTSWSCTCRSSMLMLPTDCLGLVLLQDGPRIDLRCFFHELAFEISCCAQYVIEQNFLLAHFTKIRQSDRTLSTELWSHAGKLVEAPDRGAATDRCVATFIS